MTPIAIAGYAGAGLVVIAWLVVSFTAPSPKRAVVEWLGACGLYLALVAPVHEPLAARAGVGQHRGTGRVRLPARAVRQRPRREPRPDAARVPRAERPRLGRRDALAAPDHDLRDALHVRARDRIGRGLLRDQQPERARLVPREAARRRGCGAGLPAAARRSKRARSQSHRRPPRRRCPCRERRAPANSGSRRAAEPLRLGNRAETSAMPPGSAISSARSTRWTRPSGSTSSIRLGSRSSSSSRSTAAASAAAIFSSALSSPRTIASHRLSRRNDVRRSCSTPPAISSLLTPSSVRKIPLKRATEGSPASEASASRSRWPEKTTSGDQRHDRAWCPSVEGAWWCDVRVSCRSLRGPSPAGQSRRARRQRFRAACAARQAARATALRHSDRTPPARSRSPDRSGLRPTRPRPAPARAAAAATPRPRAGADRRSPPRARARAPRRADSAGSCRSGPAGARVRWARSAGDRAAARAPRRARRRTLRAPCNRRSRPECS